jgi:hypothetical protein
MAKLRVAAWPTVLFLFGYFALLLFWVLGTYPRDVTGLFAYRSATWGDGLLLPLLALCLGLLVNALPQPADGTPLVRWPTILAAVCGGAAGGAVIAAWLVDPTPSLNWTIPRPHTFNLAGEWHAGFLIAACALFAALWVEALRRLRSAESAAAQQVLGSLPAAGAFACTIGYAWLAIADSARAGSNGGRGSLFALVLAALLLAALLGLAARGALKSGVSAAATGLLGAVAVVAFANMHGQANALLYTALVGAVGAGLALACKTDGANRSPLELAGVAALFVALTLYAAAVRSDRISNVVLVPVVALLGASVLRLLNSSRAQVPRRSFTPGYLAVSGISAALLAACVFGVWLSASGHHAYITGGFILTIIGAVLGGFFLQYFKEDFVALMQAEGDKSLRRPDGQPGPEQRAAAVEAWPLVLGFTISAFASLLVLTIAVAPSLGWRAGDGALRWRTPLIGLGIAVLLLIPAVSSIRQATRKHPKDRSLERKPSGSPTPAVWCLLSSGVSGAFCIYDLLSATEFNWLALGQSVLLAAFVTESLLGNGAWLHTARLRPIGRIALPAGSVAVCVVFYWSLTEGIRSAGGAVPLGSALAAWMCCVLYVLLLAEATGSAIYVAGGCTYRTDYPPANNVGQDTLLMTVLWLVLGWVPQVIVAYVPASAPERWAAIGTILAGFMLLFGPAFLWVLENNDTHVERQRLRLDVREAGLSHDLPTARSSIDRIRSLPARIRQFARPLDAPDDVSGVTLDDEQFITRLSGHTAVQNAVALALTAVTIVGLLGVSTGIQPEATGLATLPGTLPSDDAS